MLADTRGSRLTPRRTTGRSAQHHRQALGYRSCGRICGKLFTILATRTPLASDCLACRYPVYVASACLGTVGHAFVVVVREPGDAVGCSRAAFTSSSAASHQLATGRCLSRRLRKSLAIVKCAAIYRPSQSADNIHENRLHSGIPTHPPL
eukprot:GHVU01061965.1.p1 GENE.GHVU01061965.1~~GHVU01061965.1.p1  ORF type:complete len:150 (-),score=2.37 GHVU01061965.1:128-577(-)